MESNKYFHAIDFVIFIGMLIISSAVGVFFAYRDRETQSTDNYYFGSRKVSPILVSFSLAVSFISAITVIGLPVEIYLFGTIFAWVVLSHLIAVLISSTYYIPLLHRLQLKSVYQYLNLRFHTRIRSLASGMAMINLILYMGVTVYIPALALSAVTPLELNWSIALTSLVCTFYTSIGGMKAVIWTDFIQAIIMLTGMFAVFIKATIVVGGLGSISEAVERGERNNFWKFNIDPRVRSTVWTVVIGLTLNNCFKTGCNQVFTQRYMSCDSVKSARIALWLKVIPGTMFTLLSVGNGLAMYAFYEGCDPYTAKQITKPDQSMPRLAMEIFQDTPGMAGLFVSSAYCGTLSTISSGVNALSALALMDFILPCFPKMSSKKRIVLSKVLTIIFGVLVMTLAYLVSLSSSNIIQITTSITGSIGGPVIAVFTMGMFMPWINHWGALIGIVGGWLFAGWIAISAMSLSSFPGTTEKLPLSIDSCPTSNYTTQISTNYSSYSTSTTEIEYSSGEIMTTNLAIVESPVINYTLYSISPFYYGVIGFLTCILIGHIISLITGFNKPSKADPMLFVPIFNYKVLRFGVPEIPSSYTLASCTPEEEKLNKTTNPNTKNANGSPIASNWEDSILKE
uniref:sodium-coupled monocarboxylate transporter 1-like isoform X1 n=1 Tax=Styela clava TaxID=7725 RepID=UPI00193AA989|nr:sodium-coupled monocarboxylate transporter 1-like isoform X1 [Styela clava]